MKKALFLPQLISLLLSSAHSTFAQDKTQTKPIEAPQPILVSHTNRPDRTVTIRIYCNSTVKTADYLLLVDGKETNMTDLGTVNPDSVKSIRTIKPNDPEFITYADCGKQGVILIETHIASTKSSKKRRN